MAPKQAMKKDEKQNIAMKAMGMKSAMKASAPMKKKEKASTATPPDPFASMDTALNKVARLYMTKKAFEEFKKELDQKMDIKKHTEDIKTNKDAIEALQNEQTTKFEEVMRRLGNLESSDKQAEHAKLHAAILAIQTTVKGLESYIKRCASTSDIEIVKNCIKSLQKDVADLEEYMSNMLMRMNTNSSIMEPMSMKKSSSSSSSSSSSGSASSASSSSAIMSNIMKGAVNAEQNTLLQRTVGNDSLGSQVAAKLLQKHNQKPNQKQ